MAASRRREAGMVTAELAACLPVLMLVLGVALSAVSIASAHVRAQDASQEAARAAARGDDATAERLARGAAPGGRLSLSRAAGDVTARVRLAVRPLGGLLPVISVQETSVAALEPGVGPGPSP